MSQKECSIAFTGDIGFDRFMAKKWEDEELLSQGVLDFFHSADHVVANVEGALINAVDDGSHGIFFHSMDPAATSLLKKIGSDIWSIGNNHTMDAGVEGLVSTRTIAADMGCRTFGAGLNEIEASEPVYLEEAGGIGMFGVSYLNECIPATETEPGIFRWNDFELIEKRIKEVKKTCRWCIIVSHGGEEFAAMPNVYTRNRYLKFLELGADIVVAHHPHVVENYELPEENKAIFYSLGNFIFDTPYQRAHPYTDCGVLLKLILTEDKLDFEALGTKIVRGEEHIVDAELPGIFENIDAEQYELLAPLGAASFLDEERKKMIYLEPDRFKDASQEVWDAYYYSTEPDGYFEKEHMDLSIIVPFAATAKEGAWKKSSLENVKNWMISKISEGFI